MCLALTNDKQKQKSPTKAQPNKRMTSGQDHREHLVTVREGFFAKQANLSLSCGALI